MKKEILRILRNNKDYVSGQSLCNILGVSRTAVWKIMNQLKEDGYEIEAISKRGYKLVKQPDVLTKEELESRINTGIFGRRVECLDEINSTNSYAKKLAEDPNNHGVLVVAEKQTHGKGRRGKVWESPKGTGIWMSIILKPQISPTEASMLTLVAGLSVSKAILKVTGIHNEIKWPNDIVVNGKKICGILTEMSTEFDYINHVVIGIGINVNTKGFPEEIKNIATSLMLEHGQRIMRAELIEVIMKEFEHYYTIFMDTRSLKDLKLEYNQNLVSLGKEIVIIENGHNVEAIALGITDNGELQIRTRDGKEKNVIAGEVSVRGVYGYV